MEFFFQSKRNTCYLGEVLIGVSTNFRLYCALFNALFNMQW